MIKKAGRIDSRDDVAGGLLPLRIFPTNHAANHDDDHHFVPGWDAASERCDV